MDFNKFDGLNLIHYAIRLPVAFLRDGKPEHALPATIRSVASIIFHKTSIDTLSLIKGQTGVAQYLASPYKENFIYIELRVGEALLVGPLLTEPMLEGALSNLIRARNLPLKKKSVLLEYFSSLPLINEDSYFYTGKLLEILLQSPEIPHYATAKLTDSPPLSSASRRLGTFQHPPYFLEQEIIRRISEGDPSAEEVLDQINILHRSHLAADPLRSLRNSLICDCTFLARAAIAGGVTPDEAFGLSDAFILKIEEIDCIPLLEALERRMVTDYAELVHSLKHIRYSKPIRAVIEYINNHLSENLTLPLLARICFMNPQYLSTLFKKEVGTTISKFILSRRIQEAQYFLCYSENSIASIANFYQFCSQSHFISCFRKEVGMTPLQYRKYRPVPGPATPSALDPAEMTLLSQR